jgi:hypothetical protein
MDTLNINLKIELKKTIGSKGIEFISQQGLNLSDIYKALNNDTFLLPYKVQKLSKKAKNN